MSNKGWIGVDLDGTLALYNGWQGGKIGPPISAMVNRVKKWLSEGVEVRIVTARVACTGLDTGEGCDDVAFADAQRALIAQWCYDHIGCILPVTAQKDFAMIELWDDRAVAVHFNTGEPKQ